MKRIALVILGSLAAVAGLEGVLRCMPVATSMAYQPTSADAPIMRGKPNYDYVYSKGWNFRAAHRGHLNNFGYPADTDYDPGKRNVLVIGDSFIEGLMLDPSARLQSQLEGLLDHSASVYGLGRSGSELSQYLGVARWAAGIFKPEAIVFNLVAEDVASSLNRRPGDHHFDVRDGACRLERTERAAQPAVIAYARQSMVYEYFFNNLKLLDSINRFRRAALAGSANSGGGGEVVDLTPAASRCFLQLVGDMTGLPKDRLVFVINGDTPSVYSGKPVKRRDIDDFADLAEAAGYPVIRMQEVFQRDYAVAHSRFDFRPIDAHWNERAHRLAAEAVAARLPNPRIVADGSEHPVAPQPN